MKVVLWDSHFQNFNKPFVGEPQTTYNSVASGEISHDLTVGSAKMELYDWPGEFTQRFDGITPSNTEKADEVNKAFPDANRTAQIRYEQEIADAIVIHGSGDTSQMSAGGKFSVSVAADITENLKVVGAYALTEVSISASQPPGVSSGGGYSLNVGFSAIPEKIPYRSARVTPKPVVHGVQTAVVVGPPNEEIYTDKYGRVKVQFFWERGGKNNAESSLLDPRRHDLGRQSLGRRPHPPRRPGGHRPVRGGRPRPADHRRLGLQQPKYAALRTPG